MPSACNLASALGPTPLILRQARGQIIDCRSLSSTMETPLGLLNSLAILASCLLGATPTEQVRPVAACISLCRRSARLRPWSFCPPSTWVKSMYTSSTPRSSICGAMEVMMALNWRENCR
ncbi:hypothetical protein D3C72_1900720 [compost metagenome]